MSFCFCIRSVNLHAKRPLIMKDMIFVIKNNFFTFIRTTKFLWDIIVCNMQIFPCPFQKRGKGIEQVFSPFMTYIWEYFYWTLLDFWSSGLHRSISMHTRTFSSGAHKKIFQSTKTRLQYPFSFGQATSISRLSFHTDF